MTKGAAWVAYRCRITTAQHDAAGRARDRSVVSTMRGDA